MARSRNIKPGFFKNEELAECSLAARLCFAGLWLLADREGRLEDRPKRIKGELFPFDTFEVGPLLDELHTHGFIVRYRNEAGSFIQISKFLDHQNPHHSEKPSVIKPPALPESEASKPRQLPDNDGDDGGGDSGSTPGKDPPSRGGDSGSTPGKDPPSRGGRNPLNPESLNPDSGILNPERTVGATPPPPAREDDGPPDPGPPPEDPYDAPPPTPAGRLGMAIRATGLHPSRINAHDPVALALLERGVTVEQFAEAVRDAMGKRRGDPWRYALTVLERRVTEAAELAAGPAVAPDPMAWRRTFEGVQRRAEQLGVKPRAGEMAADFERRVLTAHQRAASAAQGAPA